MLCLNAITQSTSRRLPAGTASRLLLALLVFTFFSFSGPALAAVRMDTGDKIFSLDPPPSPEAAEDAGDGPAPGQGGRDEAGAATIPALPWGIVPEVYVPWLPGGGIRPPHRPGGHRPPHAPGWNRPQGNSGGKHPPSIFGGQRPAHSPGARPPYGKGLHDGQGRKMRQHSEPHRGGAPGLKSGYGSAGTTGESIAAAYGPGRSSPSFGIGGKSAGASNPGGINNGVLFTPQSRGFGSKTASPPASPGEINAPSSGPPARQLYPGMRPPLPGNTPQPIYPGEKPYAPGPK